MVVFRLEHRPVLLCYAPNVNRLPTLSTPISDVLPLVHSKSLHTSRDCHGNQNKGEEKTVLESLWCWKCFMSILQQVVSASCPRQAFTVGKYPQLSPARAGPGMQPFATWLSRDSNHQGAMHRCQKQIAYLRWNHRKEKKSVQADLEEEGWTIWLLESWSSGSPYHGYQKTFPEPPHCMASPPSRHFTTTQHGFTLHSDCRILFGVLDVCLTPPTRLWAPPWWVFL